MPRKAGHVLGALFRGKFLAALDDAIRDGILRDDLSDRTAHRRGRRLDKTSWIVYAKRPLGGPEQVFQYLGRYTHRVAISNARLVSDDGDQTVFHTRGSETASVPPAEFIGRFLQHLLPKRFVKIRHFGLHASTNVREGHRLESARLHSRRACREPFHPTWFSRMRPRAAARSRSPPADEKTFEGLSLPENMRAAIRRIDEDYLRQKQERHLAIEQAVPPAAATRSAVPVASDDQPDRERRAALEQLLGEDGARKFHEAENTNALETRPENGRPWFRPSQQH